MKIVVACEYSNIVAAAFRQHNHDVISCDLIANDVPCTSHLIMDAIECCHLVKPDFLIAFPPCTFLAKVQMWRMSGDLYRWAQQIDAIQFFMDLYNFPCSYTCIENPAGIMNTFFRSPDMILHPYMFGDPYQKEICLWTKNLPPLFHGPISPGRKHTSNHVNSRMSQELKSKIKSKFFPGLASAMAQQWSNL